MGRGIKFWNKQEEENSLLWKRFVKAWDEGVRKGDISIRFDTSYGTIRRLIMSSKLEKRSK